MDLQKKYEDEEDNIHAAILFVRKFGLYNIAEWLYELLLYRNNAIKTGDSYITAEPVWDRCEIHGRYIVDESSEWRIEDCPLCDKEIQND